MRMLLFMVDCYLHPFFFFLMSDVSKMHTPFRIRNDVRAFDNGIRIGTEITGRR